MTDVSSEEDKFPRQWASLTDKGFQRAGEYRRATTSTEKTRGEDLSRRHVERNKNITSGRIIVAKRFWTSA